jgi:cytochrome b involved in lipid metabolism
MITTSNPGMINTDHRKGQYTWDEIYSHSKRTDRWIVIDKRVYDVTRWIKHPGGQLVLDHHAGQDATVRIENKFY